MIRSAKTISNMVILMTLTGMFFGQPVMADMFVSTGMNSSVGYSYRYSAHTTGASESQQVIEANIDNRFFIWQDWFATGHANLSFLQEQTASQNGTGDSLGVTGSFGLNLLPQSTFPFSFSYSRTDSSTNPDFPAATDDEVNLSEHIVNNYLSVSQGLVGDDLRFVARYTQNQFESKQRGEYGSDTIGLNGLIRMSNGVIRTDASQKTETTYDGLDRETQRASVNHAYTGSRQLTITTIGTTSETVQTSGTTDEGDLYSYTMKLNQASSNLIWKSVDKRTMVSGSLRFFGMDVAVSTDPTKDNESTNVSTTLGVVHRFTPNLNLKVNAAHAVTVLTTGEDKLDRADTELSYRSNRIELGDFTYNWRVAGKLRYQGDKSGKVVAGSTTLGHVLARVWYLSKRQRIILNGYQDIGYTSTSVDSDTDDSKDVEGRTDYKLGHRVTLGWNESEADTKRQFQVALSDRRSQDDRTSVMQSLTLDLNQDNRLNRQMSLGGNLNYQLTNYENKSTETTTSSTSSTSMSVKFKYLSPFSIAGMIFNSDYRLSQSVSTSSGDPISQQVWNNRLIYRVGKIDTSLQYMYREARKIGYNMVYFNLKRVF